MAANTITYNRNTTYTMTHNYQKNGVASSAGQVLYFTIKKTQNDAVGDDSSAILVKTIAMNGSSTQVTINPEDIAPSVKVGTYYYDFKIKESDGPPKRIYQGTAGTFSLVAYATNREV